MSFIYPRIISIFREALLPSGAAGFGAQGVQEPQTVNGSDIWQTTPVFSGVPCSIQEYRSGQRPVDNLPGSASVTATWKIYIPRLALPLGSVKVRDFLMDDQGIKYHVVDPYWNSLGHRLYAVFLET